VKVSICAAAELQQTNFMTRLNFDSKDKKPDLDPYVAVDVDEVPTLPYHSFYMDLDPSF
jgi:hypothetical protein